jgi:hypothetical protein
MMHGFESPFPGNPSRKRPGSEAELFADMKQEIARSRIICPYPPGTTQNFRNSALIISNQHRVRYTVEMSGYYFEVSVYDLEHLVAAGWLRQERSQLQYARRGMTQTEERNFLDSLTPHDTAWKYDFSVGTNSISSAHLGSRPVATLPDAEWFAAVITSAIWGGVRSQGYIMEPDDIPDCPTVAAPVRRPHYTTRQPWRKVRGRAKW